VKVRVPTPLRSYTGQRSVVEAGGATVDDVLIDLDRQFPGIRFRMVDEQGRIRPHMRVFINDEATRDLRDEVAATDELTIMQALSGGSHDEAGVIRRSSTPSTSWTSWLAPEPVVERLQLDDASWVDIVRGLVPRADAVHDKVLASVEWEQGRVDVAPRSPRQQSVLLRTSLLQRSGSLINREREATMGRGLRLTVIVGAALAVFVAIAPLAAGTTSAPTTRLKDPFAPVPVAAPAAAPTTATPGSGHPPVSAGATPPTAPSGARDDLAFTGASGVELWLALGALVTITLGLVLRPRRRPFPHRL
jgi:molybdopterin synthase sulfur carrier subunit